MIAPFAGRTFTEKCFWLYNLIQCTCGHVVLFWGGQLGNSLVNHAVLNGQIRDGARALVQPGLLK